MWWCVVKCSFSGARDVFSRTSFSSRRWVAPPSPVFTTRRKRRTTSKPWDPSSRNSPDWPSTWTRTMKLVRACITLLLWHEHVFITEPRFCAHPKGAGGRGGVRLISKLVPSQQCYIKPEYRRALLKAVNKLCVCVAAPRCCPGGGSGSIQLQNPGWFVPLPFDSCHSNLGVLVLGQGQEFASLTER